MKRRDFIQLAGLGTSAMAWPLSSFAHIISPDELLNPGPDVGEKKKLVDVALNTAKTNGASYTDVRIGRYLNQFVITRENKVQSIINTRFNGVNVINTGRTL